MCCGQNRWADEIQVLKIKLFEKGTLKALVDIQLGPLTIRGLRVMESGDRLWTAWPQDSYRTQDGFRRFVDLVQPTKDVGNAVNQAIKEKWAKIGGLYSTDKSFN
jgi:DNA-binding cell septation regulator SpoVG